MQKGNYTKCMHDITELQIVLKMYHKQNNAHHKLITLFINTLTEGWGSISSFL